MPIKHVTDRRLRVSLGVWTECSSVANGQSVPTDFHLEPAPRRRRAPCIATAAPCRHVHSLEPQTIGLTRNLTHSTRVSTTFRMHWRVGPATLVLSIEAPAAWRSCFSG